MHQRQGLLVSERSPCLIIHCHGGGFVAQSSASHQVFCCFIIIIIITFTNLSRLRTTPTRSHSSLFLVFVFNPRDLYYRGYKKKK